MPEFFSAKLGEIKYSGEFDYEGLYLCVYNWLKNNRYEVQEVYKHKMTPAGAEVELTFKGNKKITEFVKYKLEAETKGWNITEHEAVKEGKKQKLNKGRLIIALTMTLELDWQKKYQESPFWQRVYKLLAGTILKKKALLDWGGNLVGEAYQLHTAIKKQLNMSTAYSAW